MSYFTINSFNLLLLHKYIASSWGHVKIVKKLLVNEANIEAEDNIGWTPLIHGKDFKRLFVMCEYFY